MDKLKQYVTFTVLASLVVVAAGWFLLVSPKRSQAAELRAQADTQSSDNARLQTQLQVLKAQAKDLPKQQAKLAAIAAKIPGNPALPTLVRAFTGASTSSNVELVSVTPAPPVAVAVAAATAAAPVAATGSGAAPASGATAASGASAAKPAGATAARPGAAAGAGLAGQLAAIPVTLSVAGTFFDVQAFVSNLENLPRALRVTNLKVDYGLNPVKKGSTVGATAEDGRSLLATISAEVYMAVNRPAPVAVTVPGAAGPTTVTAPVATAKK